MQLFSVRYNVFKKKTFFDPENMKKLPSKVAHNRSKFIFFSTDLADQMVQKQKAHTAKSPLMQNWVFRLGLRVHFGFDFEAEKK